jgi:hypothetical protein
MVPDQNNPLKQILLLLYVQISVIISETLFYIFIVCVYGIINYFRKNLFYWNDTRCRTTLFLNFTCFAIDMTIKGSLANFWGGSKKLTIGSASQIIRLEWKVQRSVHKIPSLVSFLSHINPFRNLEKYFRKNNFNIILPVTPNVVECNINAHQSLALRMKEICSPEIFVTRHDTWTNNIWFL